jgi:hypothetical protein
MPPPIGLIRISWKQTRSSEKEKTAMAPPIGLIRISWKPPVLRLPRSWFFPHRLG